MEPYEETKDYGWDKKALQNPYLAAEQYLHKLGMPVISSNSFEKLKHLPEGGTVFISNGSKVLTAKRVDKLLQWVNNGGHIIIAAPVYNKDKPDALLTKFNVENHPVENNKKSKVKGQKKLSTRMEELNKLNGIKNYNADKLDNNIPDDEITRLKFTDLDTDIEINFSPKTHLTHPALYADDNDTLTEPTPSYWIGSEYGVHFMQFDVGDGLLTVISDKGIWDSHNIGTLDHAYLIWTLSNHFSEVILLYGAQMPSIFNFFWKYAFETILSGSIFLLAWLIFKGRRFGKIHPQTSGAHRSIAEHIQASSNYLWRNRKFEQLLQPVRQDVIQHLHKYFPSYSYLDHNEKIHLISEHTKIDTEQIELALMNSSDNNSQDFQHIMSTLQKIRNAI
ncbi:MAG: DUF4350 domain-containing protein [Gammaproteobacteria bacterium]|nr:DUF4350 domain-containing protein [Gammaproteobacteria bacterium]